MESTDAHSSSRKRKSSSDSAFSFDRHAMPVESVESLANDSPQLFRQLESKDRDVEARINGIYAEMKTIQTVNQDLKSQVQTLQQQYDRLLLHNRELESRMSRWEQQSHHLDTDDQNVFSSIDNVEQNCQEIKPKNPDLDQLVKDFAERCELVESNNQGLTERLDSCQQNVSKLRQKNEGFENQLSSLQQRFNRIGIDENSVKHNENEVIVDTNTSQDRFRDNNDGCTLIEEALCKPYKKQIVLATDEIQYGIFDVCEKYEVILMKEKDQLKLFDEQGKVDQRPWGELGHSNYVTCIQWCSFLDKFLLLSRFKLHTISIKRNEKTLKVEFDCLAQISSIRVYSLNFHPSSRSNKGYELLRFMTTSPNLPDQLFVNRGYRRIELLNTNSWKVRRGWSKQDLDYGELDEIGLIICSSDGSYLAMNIKWNDRLRYVDLRENDEQMTLIKSIRMSKDCLSLRPRLQISVDEDKWLLIDENNQCYKVSTDPHDRTITPMRTEHIQAIDNVTIHLRFFANRRFILVGAVIGNSLDKRGVFNFYKLSLS